MQNLSITFRTGERLTSTFTRVHYIHVTDETITIRGEYEDKFGGAAITRWFKKSDVADWYME